MSVIKTVNLTHVYSQGNAYEKAAIVDVNLEIEQGAFVGIIGHTGSGKSTLIQHLNGLMRPTSGQVLLDGKDIWADPANIRQVRFQVGLVFQYPEYQLFEETVYKDIAFGPRNMGLSEAEIDYRVREAARFVELKEKHLQKSPFELSGGQKRRVAIAGILAMSPKVLILDEPTAGLDPKGRDRILGQLKEYHQQVGNTILLVSHSMEDVARYAQKVLVMNQSRVFLYDDVDRVFAHAQEIASMGLAVPEVAQVCHELHQSGLPIADNLYTVQKAKDAIIQMLSERGIEPHA